MKKNLLCMFLVIFSFQCYAKIIRTQRFESDGFTWVQTKKGKAYFGAEDMNGNTIVPVGNYLVMYKDGLFNAYRPSLNYYAYYDIYGNELISTDEGYDKIYFINEENIKGYFQVGNNGKEGACDLKGNRILDPIYDSVIFYDKENYTGYFGVEINGKEGAYDIKGKRILGPIYDCVLFSDGKFKYEKNGEFTETDYSLDENGNVIRIGQQDSSSSSSSKKSNSGSSNNLCSRCSGSGTLMFQPCPFCGGTGRIVLNVNPNNVTPSGGYISTPTTPTTGGTSGGTSGGHSTPKQNNGRDCPECHGTGNCQICNGSGIDYGYPSNGTKSCAVCHGRKKCTRCNGTGKVN